MQQHTSLESHYINYISTLDAAELNFNIPQVLVPIICPIGGGGGSDVHDIIQNESSL